MPASVGNVEECRTLTRASRPQLEVTRHSRTGHRRAALCLPPRVLISIRHRRHTLHQAVNHHGLLLGVRRERRLRLRLLKTRMSAGAWQAGPGNTAWVWGPG